MDNPALFKNCYMTVYRDLWFIWKKHLSIKVYFYKISFLWKEFVKIAKKRYNFSCIFEHIVI